MMLIHIHDVFKPCHRPDSAKFFIFIEVHRIFSAKPSEVVPVGILLEEGWICPITLPVPRRAAG